MPGSNLVLSFVASMLMTGCAAFRGGPSYIVEPWPLSTDNQNLPSVSVIFDAADQDGSRDFGPIFDEVQGATVRAFEQSGLFSTVSLGLRPSDLRAHVRLVRYQGAGGGSAFLMGFTLGIVPAVISQTIAITTELKRPDGTVLGPWERREDNTVCLGWVMLPAWPFVSPQDVLGDIVFDLNKSILIEVSRYLEVSDHARSPAGSSSSRRGN